MNMTNNDKSFDLINNDISNDIHSYIAEGYRISAKDSVIDKEDKSCTFKAVLTKDVDGTEYRVAIKMYETNNDSTGFTTCSYYKTEEAGGTVLSRTTITKSIYNKPHIKETGNSSNVIYMPFIKNLKLKPKSEESEKINSKVKEKEDSTLNSNSKEDTEDDLISLVKFIFNK